MAKSKEKLLAREMRRKGESLAVIAEKVGVTKGSVSLWCRDIVLNEQQVRKLLHREDVGRVNGRMKAWEWHREEKRRRVQYFHEIGYREVGEIGKNELFLLGLALYWSEGSKNDGRILLTNSDPYLIKLYIRWIKECFGIKSDEITCRLTINELHKDRMKEIEQYWVKIVGIPFTQFTKTTTIHSKLNKLYENRKTYYGVLSVHVQKSTNLSYQVMGSIDRLREISGFMVE